MSVDQREALVVCLELNHPAQLQLLRKLQKQQVKEMDAGAARGDRWHGTGAAANRRLASSPRGTSGKGGWGSGDEQARVSLRGEVPALSLSENISWHPTTRGLFDCFVRVTSA